MDALQKEHQRLLQRGSLQKGADDVQKIIDQLTRAKEAIAADPKSAAMTLAKLQQPIKKGFEAVNDDMKEVYSALGKYSKALDKQFKNNPLPTEDNDALASHPSLINRAIAMHLLREGQFAVASTFISEANAHPPAPTPTPNTPNPYPNQAWEQDFASGTFRSQTLQQHFAEMYHILHELRQRHNLSPAIEWARKNSAALEKRGSNLEFELCRLQFVCLFMRAEPTTTDGDHDTVMSDSEEPSSPRTDTEDTSGPLRAWAYARSEFHAFSSRYSREIQALMGAMAFWQNVSESPYRRIFGGTSSEAWDAVAASFTKEFCSLLGLSADSPLYVAGTAGAIALPVLMKLQKVMREKRTEWTTVDELPVEIPLPPAYHFHSIFVCPVSKEQATDTNPPMMMVCGHVICKESMERLARTQKFKCPYCPAENNPREALRVFL